MNKVETGFSSYLRSGGKSLYSTILRTSSLAILGIVIVAVFSWACQAAEASSLPSQPADTESVTVFEVNSSEKDGRTTVEISLSGKASYNSFTLSDPLRLVLDVQNAVLRSRPDPVPVGDGVVEQVRMGQFNPSVVRVVFDLSRTTSYTIVQTEDNPEVITVAFPRRVTGIDFFDRDGRGEAVIYGTGSLQYETSSLAAPPRIVVDLPETVLTSDVLSVPVSHPQVTQVRVSQFTPEMVRVVLDLVKSATYSVSTSSDRPGEVAVNLGYRVLGADFTCDAKSTKVNVVSSGSPEVKFTVLTGPYRIVMDFENSTLDTTEKVISVGDGVVERIRLAQYGPMTVRVVLDLNYYVGHSVLESVAVRGAAVEVLKSSIYKKTIVIDPGHGGPDPGAIGSTGLHEKSVVLDIAKLVATQLEAMGSRVILTRSDDTGINLPERVKVASNAQADAFISIHANASRGGGPTGTETLYSNRVSMSKVLAEHVQAALVNKIGQFDRGARERNDLIVIREASCPACLVEVVFMSNLTEELLLLDPAFRGKAAQGIANGIASYFQWRKDRLEVPAEEASEEPPASPAQQVGLPDEGTVLSGEEEGSPEDAITQTPE